MGQKAEISWSRVTDEGKKLQVYAHHVGTEWRFHSRARRFDLWQQIEKPPLEDWLELLDAVERRMQRRLMKPEEGPLLRKRIKKMFPAADL